MKMRARAPISRAAHATACPWLPALAATTSVASARAKVHLEHAVADDPELLRLLDEVRQRELDPLSAVREILEKVFHIGSDRDRTRLR